MRRGPLPLAIVYGSQFAHCNIEAGFLPDLSDDTLARRLVYVCPPSRHCPASEIFDLTNEKNAPVFDHRSTDIDLRRRIASRGERHRRLNASPSSLPLASG